MKYLYSYLLLFTILINGNIVKSQMITPIDTLYGDEWIKFDQSYYKINIVEDDIYRINLNTLNSAGLPMNTIAGGNFQVFAYGKEIPIYTSTEVIFTANDYLEFVGHKNEGFIDRFLYKNWNEEQLNPSYSLFTDTMAYFLTWNNTTDNKRYQTLENDIENNTLTPESHYTAESKQVFNKSYIKPTHNGSAHIRYSNFEMNEGYGSSFKNNQNIEFNIDYLYDNGDNPKIHLRTGANNNPHRTKISINDNLLFTNIYNGYKVSNLTLDFDISQLKTSNIINIKDENNKERTSVAQISLFYPRMFNANNNNNFDFTFPQHNTAKYFEINNFEISANRFILYDENNNVRINDDFRDNSIQFILPTCSKKRSIAIINESNGYRDISSIKPISFINYSALQPDYVILTSKRLNQFSNEDNSIQEYADYRASEIGGHHEVAIINVEDLYNQYSYGIERHSLSIKNFANRYLPVWNEWKHAFIIGRALSLKHYRKSNQINSDKEYFLVPTLGETGSDNLLFAKNHENNPQVAVGRLAVMDEESVTNYLDKIKSQENYLTLNQTILDKYWTKNVLHLGGGNGIVQQNRLKQKLNELKNIIENNQYGAQTKSYFKTTNDVIQSALTDELINYINNGASIISFLGHSSVGTFDFNIEQVDAYQNKDKYPILLSMGCYSGNIHSKINGINHEFVLKKDKGVIAFIASGGTAYESNLILFEKRFYNLLGGEMYGKSIGSIWLNVYNTYKTSTTVGNVSLMQQNTIHGDPAIKLYPYKGPDFTLDYSKIRLDPKIISSVDDEFILNYDIVNLGRGVNDSISVNITQLASNNSIIWSKNYKVLTPKSRSTYTVNIPLKDKINSIGKNLLKISIDDENSIIEYPINSGEQNNTLVDDLNQEGYTFYIVDNNIKPIYPIPFGIVRENIELNASISNLFVEEQSYIIQIDSTKSFRTPIEETSIIQQGGLLTWKPSFSPTNNTVYYWRVSPDSVSNAGYIWNTSSFLFKNNISDGWNQSHRDQLKQNTFENYIVNSNGKLNYATNKVGFRLLNRHREIGKFPSLIIDNSIADYNNGLDIKSGVYLIVSDTIFSNPWINPKGGNYGSDTPDNADRKVFPFKTETEADRLEVMEFIENVIPSGVNVMFMNIQSNDDISNADQWINDEDNIGKSIFSILEAQGAIQIRNLAQSPDLPYLFAFRKNHSVLEEILAENPDKTIDKIIYCAAKWYKGKMVSSMIGPSKSWDHLDWDEQRDGSDESSLEILLFNNESNLQQVIPIENMGTSTFDLSNIDATEFPYIKLQYETKDSINHTSPNLSYWRIIYHGVPEILYNPEEAFNFHSDSLYRGENMNLTFAVKNISQYPTDSFNIVYNISDKTNTIVTSKTNTVTFLPKESKIFEYSFDTKDMTDNFNFSVKINDEKSINELHYHNNLLFKEIVLLKDDKNPLLDVRFDGLRIVNDEFVSSQSVIDIQLRDENNFLLIDDLNLFEIYLSTPDKNKTTVDLMSEEIEFIPGKENDNTAHIIYRPALDLNGRYQLEVRAKDVAGNTSGYHDYHINFNVLLDEKITNVLNFPNPFSKSTQFIFQLGGEEVPNDFSIKIISVSGKVVKEISAAEFGPIRLGLNKSNYHWDGTNDYGEPLANGVYLYYVNINKPNGERYQSIDTYTDQYFKDGWGVMTIIR